MQRQKTKEWCFFQNVQCVTLWFTKEQWPSKILSNLEIKTPFKKNVFSRFFFFFENDKQASARYKMSEILKKFILAGDEFMLEIHLIQPGFTHSACGTFTKK